MIVSLETLKAHLNLTNDYDDVLLNSKLPTAQAAIGNFIGVDLTTDYTQYVPAVYAAIPVGQTTLEPLPELISPAVESDAPAPLKEAVLQYAAYLFEYREPFITGERATPLPLGIFDLIGRYKVWNF
jgi:Phage gp6-like head-tail connector protein